MAKSIKKSSETTSSKPAPKAAVKKATKTTKPAQSGTSTAPMVDTSFAAAAAARSLVAKLPAKGSAPTTGGQHESAAFRQMKSGLLKPAGQTMSNLLDKQGGPMQKTTHEGFGSGGPQVGKNQVFGADVNRAGVPRRTGGG